MSFINVQDFLKELGAFYIRNGFQGYHGVINLVADLLPSPDLEGRLTTVQLVGAIGSRMQEVHNNGSAPPWLRIAMQYCAEVFGEDFLIENGVDPMIAEVQSPNQRSPIPIRKRGYYGPNNKKHIPRYR